MVRSTLAAVTLIDGAEDAKARGLVEKIVISAKGAIALPAERTFEEGSALLLTEHGVYLRERYLGNATSPRTA